MIYWNLAYGWRSGTRYIEAGASVADVIRYEQEELGNDLDVPEWVIEELESIPARAVVWVCRTKAHARRYGNVAYQERFDPGAALILATDQDNGYLILENAGKLRPATVERFACYQAIKVRGK